MSDTQTASLTEWLLARIAEDAADAGRQTWGQPIPGDCWGPERVLAECAARRRIVELHRENGYGACISCGDAEDLPCPTLRALASVYADHPGFRAEWTL